MPAETREDKFVRLAQNRVNKVIKGIRLIGNLSNRNNYAFTEEQVDRIFAALSSELRSARRRFRDSGSGDDRFTL